MFVRILWVAGLAVAAVATWSGLAYYATPLVERPFSPLHDLYAPTGLIGQGFGIVGSLMVICGVALYAARKRFGVLARAGRLRDWLHFHIFLCLLGPYLILLHTTFRFQGLVAISFWSMALVVGSGVFGRWVYVWIPKTINGRFLGAEDMRAQMKRLLGEAESETGLTADDLYTILRGADGVERRRPARATAPSRSSAPTRSAPAHELSGAAKSIDALFETSDSSGRPSTAAPAQGTVEASLEPGNRRNEQRQGRDRRRRPRHPGLVRAVGEALAYRLTRRRERSRFLRELSAAGVGEPARSRIVGYLDEERRVEQQLRVLHPFQRAFRYWHAFHLPLAFVMFAILAVHVAVAVAFGYTWIFGS